MSVEEAVQQLQQGKPVLVHDAEDREGETDIFMPADAVTWKDIRLLRNEAGGLICTAIPAQAAEEFELPLLESVFSDFPGEPDYDDRSSFSIPVNHTSTYTGVTDRDRATTIRKIAEAVGTLEIDFRDAFRAPGHVPILVAAEGLLEERKGHTEMAVELAERAGIPPAVVVCEMIDDATGDALPPEKAKRYGEENSFPFIDAEDLA